MPPAARGHQDDVGPTLAEGAGFAQPLETRREPVFDEFPEGQMGSILLGLSRESVLAVI